MLEKYLELLEHNLNWVKRQIREDERMKDLRFAREICNSHKYRVVGIGINAGYEGNYMGKRT